MQPAFRCQLEGVRICTYKADFRYLDIATGETIVEDAKGVKTAVYALKKRLVRALFGVEIREV